MRRRSVARHLGQYCRGAAALLSTIGALACGDIPLLGSLPVSPQVGAIIDGTPTLSDPAVVAFYTLDAGGQQLGMCSATLISPRVVLTAGHCLDGPGVVGYRVTFSPTPASDPGLGTRDVVATARPPGYMQAPLIDDDLAVALLASPAPTAPAPMNRTALSVANEGQALRVVGYGLNDMSPPGGSGVKRDVTTTAFLVYDDILVLTEAAHSVCFGDSGGPSFLAVGGREVLVGVHSLVSSSTCNYTSADFRVDRYAAFIDEFILARDPDMGCALVAECIAHCAVDGACVAGCEETDPDCSPPSDEGGGDDGSSADGGDTDSDNDEDGDRQSGAPAVTEPSGGDGEMPSGAVTGCATTRSSHWPGLVAAFATLWLRRRRRRGALGVTAVP